MSGASVLDGLRSYQPQDLDRVLQFVGECGAASDFCGCFHVGDVLHFMSNAMRGRDLDQHVRIYEADGAIQALILLNPLRSVGFNVMIAPAQRDALEGPLLAWADEAEQAFVPAADRPKEITCEGADCDLLRQDALRGLGYEASAEPTMMLTSRSLQTPLPIAPLPDGFIIRNLVSEDEAEWVIQAHSSAFGKKWTVDEYQCVMRTPGFDIEHELVVVAPDGRCAAFLIYWLDPVTRSGLFEPVGCHEDFRRQGLTSALMLEGMRRMIARGMTSAFVLHHTDNLPSTALYRSLGFTAKSAIMDFSKTIA